MIRQRTPTQAEMQRALRAARREGFERVSWSPERGFQFALGEGSKDTCTPSDVLDELARHFGGKS